MQGISNLRAGYLDFGLLHNPEKTPGWPGDLT